ncbi:hypothetical protein CEY12_20350 [Chryseobacterium sp. T16E-39]|uniref:hypothetical protein n=1 Tax=Chryseobacterium sp. T16E-39 TaxID=2015076 RepID=UPI000B5B417F|nr:hypothetical protein [Chryseobacterium sp. T16E-39]ASK32291.1 hypothetical protein CEY12_20350 [Chryseobacterium sp. T16E-39]
MKKNVLSILLMLLSSLVYSQVGISRTGANNQPNANAILDVKSTTPATAVLLPNVSQISIAANPNADDTFKGAIVYNKNNASIYEHDGNRWQSVYDYIVETKPQYLAHFSRPANLNLSCGILGCTDTGIMSISNTGGSDFKGNLINVSVTSNVLTVNEQGVYRITYRSYAVVTGRDVDVELRLQKANVATPTSFATIDSQSYTDTSRELGYTPVFNGSIVLFANSGDKFRLQGFINAGASISSSSATFQNNNTYGTGEVTFEKIVL